MIRRLEMDYIPQIRLVFMLTKNDDADFDRNAVTQCLGISPSKTSAPTLSKGKLQYVGSDIHEAEKALFGFTILPAEAPPYRMLKHACWSIEFPKSECFSLEEPLQQAEQILCEKATAVRHLCEEYNLSSDLIIRIFAESNNMPELVLPENSVSFWAAMGATISFDFYLD